MAFPPDAASNAANRSPRLDDELFREGLALHNAMHAEDVELRFRGFGEKLCNLYYNKLIFDLARSQPHYHDETTICDAVWEALKSYMKNPGQYKPDLPNALPLYKYLLMAAKRDFLNLLDSNQRRAAREVDTRFVDNYDGAQEHNMDLAADVDIEQDFIDEDSPIWHRLVELFPQPRDQALVRMMMERILRNEAYAEVLEITHLSPEDQKSEVKKHKDRIKKRIQRSTIKRDLLSND